MENQKEFDINIGSLSDADYGPLLSLKNDINVTDINWNGRQLWIDDVNKGRYLSDIVLDKRFIETFTTKIMNKANKSFNAYNPVLEADAESLRFSIIHEASCVTGRSISIRKSPEIMRLSENNMVDTGYTDKDILNIIAELVKAECNFVICGIPGVGKTEFVKWLTSFIPPYNRVITIEDSLEIHYSSINPGKDSLEMQVCMDGEDGKLTYSAAIKASLRQLPKWIILSEARGKEVVALLNSLTTGCHTLTTIHTDDVRKVPERIQEMAGADAEISKNMIYSNINIAILIKKNITNTGINRYISQMCLFSRDLDGHNNITMVVDNGRLIAKKEDFPQDILNKLKDVENINSKNNDVTEDKDVEMEALNYEEF